MSHMSERSLLHSFSTLPETIPQGSHLAKPQFWLVLDKRLAFVNSLQAIWILNCSGKKREVDCTMHWLPGNWFFSLTPPGIITLYTSGILPTRQCTKLLTFPWLLTETLWLSQSHLSTTTSYFKESSQLECTGFLFSTIPLHQEEPGQDNSGPCAVTLYNQRPQYSFCTRSLLTSYDITDRAN